ncbi:unnamed protein product [Vicia faba]|uniref:Uncharacterized protein n=1 Tax=Vicia faba TaxID=3906 RepID=A0AAV0YDL1_VICFA|nr:unnamed protein product [Vicia faba]
MDQVNTTPEPEGTSNPTQEITCPPTQEVSSNLNITPEPDVGQQEEIDTSIEPAPKKLRSNVWQEFKKMKVNGKDKNKNGTHEKGQPFLLPTISEGKQELGIGTYNPENVKKLIAKAIMMHDYPLSIVDHIGLRRVFVFLQPLFKVHTRNTIKKKEGLQVIKDGIENIRDSVGFFSATPKRHEKFEDTARQLRIV